MWRGWQGKEGLCYGYINIVLQTTFIKQMRIIQNPGQDMPWSAEELTDIRRNVLRNAIECLQVQRLSFRLDCAFAGVARWGRWAAAAGGPGEHRRQGPQARQGEGAGPGAALGVEGHSARHMEGPRHRGILTCQPASAPIIYLTDDILYLHFPQETYNRRNEFHLPDCCRWVAINFKLPHFLELLAGTSCPTLPAYPTLTSNQRQRTSSWWGSGRSVSSSTVSHSNSARTWPKTASSLMLVGRGTRGRNGKTLETNWLGGFPGSTVSPTCWWWCSLQLQASMTRPSWKIFQKTGWMKALVCSRQSSLTTGSGKL